MSSKKLSTTLEKIAAFNLESTNRKAALEALRTLIPNKVSERSVTALELLELPEIPANPVFKTNELLVGLATQVAKGNVVQATGNVLQNEIHYTLITGQEATNAILKSLTSATIDGQKDQASAVRGQRRWGWFQLFVTVVVLIWLNDKLPALPSWVLDFAHAIRAYILSHV